ncbi:hypothetical protein [Mycoplasmopsis alligatoris]|uniref:Uncharacterized protein n=1 Tax=Mycoplasmopsis alligatoris A21JP2 TaxID=747682 RepID=D4XWS2_9BACT|nr:hypothetical protein [Mycoplasmopsis alligatoris]EFF41338.1 hypothetical protein MALL_0356 [Mycoplasmopsis alligatoris A21JP2]
MGSRVTANCSICNNSYVYYFGKIKELEPIRIFLNACIKDQKDYLSKNKFTEFINNSLKNDPNFTNLDDEKKQAHINDIFEYVNQFFNDEEKELLRKNILLNYELEIYPYITIEKVKEERNIVNLPIMNLKFLGKEPYNRKYNTMAYVSFSDDQKLLTCPKDLDLTSLVTGEEEYK